MMTKVKEYSGRLKRNGIEIATQDAIELNEILVSSKMLSELITSQNEKKSKKINACIRKPNKKMSFATDGAESGGEKDTVARYT